MLNNAKKQYTEATVVFKNEHKNRAQIGKQKQNTCFPITQCWKLSVILKHLHFSYKAAKVTYFKNWLFFFF